MLTTRKKLRNKEAIKLNWKKIKSKSQKWKVKIIKNNKMMSNKKTKINRMMTRKKIKNK